MKQLIIFLILSFLFNGSTVTKKNPLKGTWELTYMRNIWNGQVYDNNFCSTRKQIKIFDDNYYLYIGECIKGETVIQQSGGGTYDYRDGILNEHVLLNKNREHIGTTVNFHVQFKGDTLIHTSPGKTKFDDKEGIYEEYVRVNSLKKSS